jgi:hypothetical protein
MVFMTGGYALSVLLSRSALLRSRAAGIAGAVLVLLIALGAQSGTLRNLVDNQKQQVDYVRAVLRSKDRARYRSVIIVVPSLADVCTAEPCGPWIGETTLDPVHAREPAGYQYILSTVGVNPNKKKLTFADRRPATIPEDAVLIDWNYYLLSRTHQLGPSN